MARFLMGVAVCFSMDASNAPCEAQDFPPKPGPEHKEMAKLIGTWKATVVEGFQAKQTGKMEIVSACNGLWIASDYKMDDGSFSGRGLDSYDTMKKKYVSVWVDSMGGSPLFFEGDYDEKAKTMTLVAEGPNPAGGKAKYTSVTKYTDDKHMTFSLSMADMVLTKIDYVRVK